MCKLTLFGAPTLECDGRSRHISRRKAKALLAYLAVTQQSHSREALVALLWPDYDRRKGRADLSRMLSVLRRTLGADAFLTDRESVAVDEEADLWVDVVQFRRHANACRETALADLEDDCRERLTRATDLYQADFLAGFTLPGCPGFDEWQLLQAEALRRDLGWILDKLARAYEARNDLAQAIAYARRWVGLDPLQEPAQRRLIALYSRNGQRAEAHRQYQACERLLAEELGVEPQPETKQLYEQIRTGGSKSPLIGNRFQLPEVVKIPRFDWPEPQPEPRHPFVGRTQELAQLDSTLGEVLAGDGGIVFVTGGAGRGKTALLEEFARRAQKTHSDLVVAGGNGNAFAGFGDPYLPFREVIGLLAGDIASRRAGGQLNVEQARRLWALLPQTTQAILEYGPQLLDVLVSGQKLLARATAAAPAGASWLVALQSEVARRQEAPGDLDQTALFGQFTSVLHHLAEKRPLLIVLDDLQWIDEASIGLLFHLGRRLAGSRILILGAYRPDELALGPNGEPHPLVQLLGEFKRTYGDVFIDLAKADQIEGRAFVDAYLDSEPNRLGAAFRRALFEKTGGHPLFTIELLRDMQDRGDLFQDKAGQWRASPELDWDTFPARVEAVIARRMGRLDETLRAVLRVASVEGERFTAEVAARVLGMKDRPLLESLSQQLARRHRLVRERGALEVGSDHLSSYQFRHALFQQYLYGQLSSGERRHLHGEVAEALAALYADDLDQVLVQLAHHYEAANDWNEAVPYRVRAGDLAYHKASLPDTVHHYRAALTHWPQADTGGRAQTLRKLGECLWILGQHREAIEALQASYDLFRRTGDNLGAGAAQQLLGRVYWELGQPDKASRHHQEALAILEPEPESEELAWALVGMSNYHMHVSDYDESISLGERALAMARRLNAEAIIIQCLCDIGSALSGRGDWEGVEMEQESLARALAANRPHDAGRAYLYIGEALIYLGRYPEARDTLEDALAYTRRMHVPQIAKGASRFLAELDWMTGRWAAANARARELIAQGHSEPPASLFQSYLGIVLGRLYNDLGQAETAHRRLAEALSGTADSLDPRVALLGELARAEAGRGRPVAVAAATREILEWTDQVRYLYPNVSMALLFICRAPLAYGYPAIAGYARSAWRQLERLDRQYRTPATAACRLEGQGWLYLAEADVAQAAASFEQAVTQWQSLGHPYDQARTLSGLGQALTEKGDRGRAKSTWEQAMNLVNFLAGQLEDPAFRSSFLDSVLVREIRDGRIQARD